MQLNHIFRTRDLVKKNEAKLAKLQDNVKVDILSNEAFLDRGFTRPKVFTYFHSYSSEYEFVRNIHLLSMLHGFFICLGVPVDRVIRNVTTFVLILQNTLEVSKNLCVLALDISQHQ